MTEDTDLDIRAAMHGSTVWVVSPTIYKEVNSRTGNWISQRSCWIKGYMQTTLVYGFWPLKLLRRGSHKKFFGPFFLFGSTSLIYLLLFPPLWAVFLYWLFTKTTLLVPYSSWVLYVFVCCGVIPLLFICLLSSSAGRTSSFL